MDILYAPWRDKYIEKSKTSEEHNQLVCVFCKKMHEDDQKIEHFILKKAQFSFVILNIYPYNGGHLLVVPYDHVANLEDLTSAARAELMELISASTVILKDVLDAHGVNAGFNLGRASGAGIPTHIHFHIVPRWQGDTSFITVIGQTKNVSVDLEKVYKKLKPVFENLKL